MTEDKKVISPGSPGDDRTPDKTIGVIKYALEDKKDEGGAGEPEASPLEPEDQGGIAGP